MCLLRVICTFDGVSLSCRCVVFGLVEFDANVTVSYAKELGQVCSMHSGSPAACDFSYVLVTKIPNNACSALRNSWFCD